MEMKTNHDLGITYIRMIPRKSGPKSKVAYNVVIKEESIIADFNADNELVGVEVLDPKLMSASSAVEIVSMARSKGPHMRRRQQPDEGGPTSNRT
jgi:hypothetical protein